MGAISENNKREPQFSLEKNKYHINAKEISGEKFSLSMFVNNENTHAKLMYDNTKLVYGINNMGCNKSDLCNHIIFDMCS